MRLVQGSSTTFSASPGVEADVRSVTLFATVPLRDVPKTSQTSHVKIRKKDLSDSWRVASPEKWFKGFQVVLLVDFWRWISEANFSTLAGCMFVNFHVVVGATLAFFSFQSEMKQYSGVWRFFYSS